jgi:RNA recognition motif-containing protein
MLTGHRSYNVTPEELFELFGKYGPIRYVATPVTDVGLDTDDAPAARSARALRPTQRELPSSSMKTSWMRSRRATS